MRNRFDWTQMPKLVAEAVSHLNERHRVDGNVNVVAEDDIFVFSRDQVWPSTGCGFGGIAGQAFTHAQAIVMYASAVSPYAVVYHDGRFAYSVYDPSEAFWEDWRTGDLAGAKDIEKCRDSYEHQEDEEKTCE